MTRRRAVVLLVLATLATGCGRKSKARPDAGAAPGASIAWKVKRTATLEYRIEDVRFAEDGTKTSSPTAVTLDLVGDGTAKVAIDGTASGPFPMAETGAIVRPDGVVPDPILDLLALAPDGGKLDATGGWTRTTPTDQAVAAAPDAIAIQSRIVAKRAGGTDTRPRFTFEVSTHILPRPVVIKAVADITKAPQNEAEALVKSLDTWVPLGHGTLVFDAGDGSVAEVAYTSVDWLSDVADFAAIDNAVPRNQITVTRQ